jgi:hypothetical protein
MFSISPKSTRRQIGEKPAEKFKENFGRRYGEKSADNFSENYTRNG